MKQDPDLLTLDETAILRFERFWIQGRPEPIDHFLPNLESRHYLPTLEELVHIEMEFLWKRCSESSTRRSPCDAPPSVEAYLRRFSALDQPIVVQRLVQQEYSLRSQYDHRSAFEEYCRRSPNLATILGKANPDATANRDLTFNERVSRRALQAPDGFELLGQLGQGGMGLVYRARDLQLDREVALKFIKPVFAADSTTCARFVEEARITGRLQHPGIPPVYQVGQLPDGRPFLAMKLIEGRTLQDLLANGAALPNRLAVFEAICQAVGFAHSRNVIHRDLKPQNVMVGSFGEVQVMDWGLAKDLSTKRLASTPPYAQETLVASIETSLNSVGYFTHAGSILGTPAFMPPEQAGGEIDRIDQRADVFALGAILCVVITGEPPYTGPTHDAVILAAVRGALQGAHARLEASGAEPELVALAKSCLMFEPEDRPADASVLATEVARLRAAAEERARTAELERVKAELRAAELRKRRKVQLSLAASVLLLLAGVGAFGWWFDHQRQEAERRSEAESQRHLRNAQAIEIALERSEQAMRVDDALRAAVALEQAENRIAEGGGEHLHARLERCRRDLRILALLNQADERHWTVTENRIPNLEEATTQWMTAFKEYGIIAGESTSSDAAEMIQASLIRDRIVAALDNCLLYRPTKGVADLLSASDPEPFRQALREAIRTNDHDQLRALAIQSKAKDQPARFAVILGRIHSLPVDERVRHLFAVLQRSPGNLSVLMELAGLYPINRADNAEKRAGLYRAALAVRPQSPSAWNNLGLALRDNGDLEKANAAFEEAIRLAPNHYWAHYHRGLVLYDKKDLAGAASAYKESIRLAPTFAWPHNGLGVVLHGLRDLDGAIAAYKESILLSPTYARPHYNLGNIFYERGDLKGASAAYDRAIRLDPEYAMPHLGIGNILRDKLAFEGAIAEYKVAIRLDPKMPEAHSNLGIVLGLNQDLEGATAAFKQAINLSPADARWHYNLAIAFRDQGRFIDSRDEWIAARKFLSPRSAFQKQLQAELAKTEQLLAIEKQLEDYLVRGAKPEIQSEWFGFAELCRQYRKRYDLAVLFYVQGLAAAPKMPDHVRVGHLYTAACCASLAADGKGVSPPPAAERSRLRRQAHDWLAAALEIRGRAFETARENRGAINAVMQQWLTDSALAGIRDPEKLKALQSDEQVMLGKLWRNIASLRDRSAPLESLPFPRESDSR